MLQYVSGDKGERRYLRVQVEPATAATDPHTLCLCSHAHCGLERGKDARPTASIDHHCFTIDYTRVLVLFEIIRYNYVKQRNVTKHCYMNTMSKHSTVKIPQRCVA